MLTDPDWRAENLPRVRESISGGNEHKDDDDQGGDMPT